MTTRNQTNSRNRRRTTLIILGIFLLAALLFGYLYLSTRGLKATYGAFRDAEAQYELAAYKPAVEANPVRQEVANLLAQVIQVKMTDVERLGMARQGIAHLNDIEGQIDDIQAQGEHVAPLLNTLDTASNDLGNIRIRPQLKEIVSLARKNIQIISDIRGLSYRADYYTDEVFERVIDDQGKMTDAHKTYLNDLIPQLEEQFNRRTNLYTELHKNSDRMGELATQIGYTVR